ncbi:9574_t:CDS:1 [Funneliformis geosporum]|uniref:1456_t:CDS:1 n=1 Tax=Funneliformis geosporum TaxID=1117311 RepID=A0A9W4SDT2_9GLOM|nr:9574_t:CDS:1 [Funneliformis geosporum]CAI2166007.1 1456_t:CDS:1 [Funneliformis geosporum]
MSSRGINNTVVPTSNTNPTNTTTSLSKLPKMQKSKTYASTHHNSLAQYTYIKENGMITIYNTTRLNSGASDLTAKYQIKAPTYSNPNVCIQSCNDQNQLYWNAFPRLNEVTTTTSKDSTTAITPLSNNPTKIKHQYLGEDLNMNKHRFSNLSTTSVDSTSSIGSTCTFNSTSSSTTINGLNNGVDGINKLIKPNSTWEISNLLTQYTLIKYEKLLGGYVISWNGRIFLWKFNNGDDTVNRQQKKSSFRNSFALKKNSNAFSNGSLIPDNNGDKQSELYCVEGLSGIGARIAEFENETNTLYINISSKILDADSYSSKGKEEELLTSFETFILITGLIAKNSAKKLSKKQNDPNDRYTDAHLFNYSPFFVLCGFCS